MQLGIMQPYFLPYLGYYSLVKHTDKWIVFDTVQFIRHGWIERNRVLKPVQGWQYISVPLQKHARETAIRDVAIRDEAWQVRILRQLEHYKKAPYYNQAMEVLESCFDIDTESITLLNVHILQHTCAYLGIDFKYEIFSEMDINIQPVTHAGEWALHITKAYGATAYINPAGGKEIFHPEQFSAAGIQLKFLQMSLEEYPQQRAIFEPGLSIIDAMMFNSADEINRLLAENTTITGA